MLSRAASSLRPLRCMLCRLDAATRAAHIQQHGLAARGSMQGEPLPCRADTSAALLFTRHATASSLTCITLSNAHKHIAERHYALLMP